VAQTFGGEVAPNFLLDPPPVVLFPGKNVIKTRGQSVIKSEVCVRGRGGARGVPVGPLPPKILPVPPKIFHVSF